MPQPFVSVIILNYQSAHHTLACVRSIREKTLRVSYEIIVVDNHSAPEDYQKLETLSAYPEVKVVRSRINTGFSGGNMFGLQFADPSARYYFFLNNDCELRTDVCSQLTDYLEAHPEAGIATAQMFNGEGELTPSFSYFPTLGVNLLGHGLLRMLSPADYPPRRQYEQPVRVPVVTGSAMFVRAEAFNAVGGLDTTYFLYCEEEDLCQRLRQRGWSAVLVPQAQYTHYMGKSTVRNLLIEQEFYISLFLYFHKYRSPLERPLLRLFYFIKNVRKFYRNRLYARLGWFILRGSPVRDSLRYRQTLS